MELKRGDRVTDGLLEGIVCTPATYVDDELRTVIILLNSQEKIDLDPCTLTKIKEPEDQMW